MALAIHGGQPIRTQAWPAWPRADEGTARALTTVLTSGRWAISGPSTGLPSFNRRFEDAFAAYHGVPHAVAVSNGSAAIRIALEALGVSPGREVLVPGLMWVACASAVAVMGAIPVFVDLDPKTLCMSVDSARAAITDSTAAILLVHAFCTVADIDGFLTLSHETGIPLIEDCSQAHGAIYRGRRVGSYGVMGVFSMQQTKVLTSGEGGAVITSNPGYDDRLQQLRADGRRYTTAAAPGSMDLEEVGALQGHNFGLSEFQCAILLDRLPHLEAENDTRAMNAAYLDALLRQTGYAQPLEKSPEVDRATVYQYCMRLDRSAFDGLNASVIAGALSAELDLAVAPVYRPIVESPLYRPPAELARDASPLPECRKALEECVSFPHAALLGKTADMDDIAAAVRKVQVNAAELAKRTVLVSAAHGS